MAKRQKTGGREKGTPNVLTSELRTMLKNLLQKEIENIPSYLDKLETKDRLEVVIKMLPYALPKIESIHMFVGDSTGKFDMWGNRIDE